MFRSWFLVLLIHAVGLHANHLIFQIPAEKGDEESYKRAIPHAERYAFSNNFDTCMIHKWIGNKVLKTSPTASCSSSKHSRLCYGLNGDRPADAQFISCYNTETLIPEFTAHVVINGTSQKTNRPKFIEDKGPYAPNPQSKAVDCAKPPAAVGEYFCSRGHLTPNAAYDTEDRRDLTFIMTNVAPQWQKFNAGNWAAVEKAVKDYANAIKREVYVFTGTAGKSKYWQWGWKWTHKAGKITVPKYFWKAVCDHVVKESIFFVAENNVEVTSTAKVTQGTCLGQPMTMEKGVVQCESVALADSRYIWKWWHGFVLPGFDPVNCGTATMGTFLNPYLKFT